MSNIISNPKYKDYYVGNKVKVVDMFPKKQKFLPPEQWAVFKDESKPETELRLEDVKGAVSFRGGRCDSDELVKGDWSSKLKFICVFGHSFNASPRLVPEGGHWCPECAQKSWNYGRSAQADPFFAQVWTPLHGPDELREYPKEISELDVLPKYVKERHRLLENP